MKVLRAEPHRPFLLGALLLAAGLGFVYALIVGLSRWRDWGWEASRPDLAQVHGLVQTLGFLGLFIQGMALRLIPAFAGGRLRHAGAAPVFALLLVLVLVLRSLAVIWLPDGTHDVAVLAIELVLLANACWFGLVVVSTLATARRGAEPYAWFFLCGVFLYFAQAVLGVGLAADELGDHTRVFSLLPHAARLHLLLAGFTLSFIGGVAGRALPPMVGLPRSDRTAVLTALTLTAACLLYAIALLLLHYGDYSRFVVGVSNAALAGTGVALALIVWQAGVLRPRADRVRPMSRPHMWLVRAAFAWLSFAALFCLYIAIDGLVNETLPAFFDIDALRHAIGAGVAMNLIFGMGLLILPEFAGERMDGSSQASRSYLLLALVNLATVLRVATGLFALDMTFELRGGLQALAGLLAEAALLVFALSLLRQALRADLLPVEGTFTRPATG